ncbi:hypothetical protein KSD_09660 [Ktedonobacter sp. SOSP1-85]|nr:hypothetical protein KSD_09660 [Ktedonobacter sp. SOSP1-85]
MSSLTLLDRIKIDDKRERNKYAILSDVVCKTILLGGINNEADAESNSVPGRSDALNRRWKMEADDCLAFA